MLRFTAALFGCVALSAAQPQGLVECGQEVVAKATQYFDILGRAPLGPDLSVAVEQTAADLRSTGLELLAKSPGQQVRIGKRLLPVDHPKSWSHYEDRGRKAWMDVIEFEDADTIRTTLENAAQWKIGMRTGESFALITFQRNPGEDVVAAGLRHDRYLFNFGIALPFTIAYQGPKPTATVEQLVQISAKIDTLAVMIEHFTRRAVDRHYQTWVAPAAPSEADARVMRMAGFARVWAEVKFNFVFLSQRPNIDWDAMLDLYMPRVAEAKNNAEYVRILQEAVALLGDSHTLVYPDRWGSVPAVRIEPVGGAPIVVAAEPSTGIKPGMELIEVEGTLVREKLTRDVYPYISSSTRQDLEVRGLREILRGEPGTTVDAVFADMNGKHIRTGLVRGGTLPQKPEAEFKEAAG